jgi:hypothetical protein
VIDYKIFTVDDCPEMKYCQILTSKMNEADSKGTDLLFSMEDSQYVVMNFIPINQTSDMEATVNYRLVNKM